MRVGIICAGDKEVAPFLPIIDECKITEKAMLKFYEGKINGIEVVALFSKTPQHIMVLDILKKTVKRLL